MKSDLSTREISPLENGLLGVKIEKLPVLIPGLLAVGVLTSLSFWLSDLIGHQFLGLSKSPISPVLLTIAIGLVINSLLPLPDLIQPGLRFSIKKILRLGIILLGIRLTIFDVLQLGALGIPIVGLCILSGLLITTRINNRLKLPEKLGTLIAVGTSICGVTAIVATGPAIDADEDESAYAIAVITIFGLFATLVYPYLANALFVGDGIKVGLFLGTSVHETAQVIGAGKIYEDVFSSPLALDVATIVKLVRNIFMAIVIPFMSYYYANRVVEKEDFKGDRVSFIQLFPIFILGFLCMAIFRSIGDAGTNSGGQAFGIWGLESWLKLISSFKTSAEVFLVAALAGVGLSTKFQSLKRLGIKPFLVGLVAALCVGIVSYISIMILGHWIRF